MRERLLSEAEQENQPRYAVGRAPFFEVYYIKWNDLKNQTAGWVRYTLLSGAANKTASLWGIFWDPQAPQHQVAIKNDYPLSELELESEPFRFKLGDAFLTHERAQGKVSAGTDEMSWHLESTEAEASSVIRHIPTLLYSEKAPLPSTKFVAPRCWYRLKGEVTVNQKTYLLQDARAHQAHFWGHKQVNGWTWGNCSSFKEDPDFAFEGVVGYISLGKLKLPPLVYFFFRWRGKVYACNHVLRSFQHNSTDESLLHWSFQAHHGNYRFVGQLKSQPEDMVYYIFQDPDGETRYSHNNFQASLTINVFERQGSDWKMIDTYSADHSAAFEFTRKNKDPRVKRGLPL